MHMKKGVILNVIDQSTFVVDVLPNDGTLVSKHVAIGTWYKVCFVIYLMYFNYCILFVFKNVEL
jgi:hypothetical protein